MPVETHEYKPFFNELQPRLETARMLQRELESNLAQRFNVFDYLRTDELGLSRIIADLLSREGTVQQVSTFDMSQRFATRHNTHTVSTCHHARTHAGLHSCIHCSDAFHPEFQV